MDPLFGGGGGGGGGVTYPPMIHTRGFRLSRALQIYYTYPHLFATQKRLSAEHWFHAFEAVAGFLGVSDIYLVVYVGNLLDIL